MTDTETTPTRQPCHVHIANALGEHAPGPRTQLRALIRTLGDDLALALLDEVHQIEAAGGLLTKDGSRRRTPGGVFFFIAYRHLTPEQQQTHYHTGYRATSKRTTSKHAKRKRATQEGQTTPPTPPITWTTRGDVIAHIRHSHPMEATTVKITVIGALDRTLEKDSCTIAMLTHTPNLDKLPKGIPRPDPPAPTTYIVYISKKQWAKVRDALANPNDTAIIEGIPMYDQEYEAMTVFATSITTKLTQQARHESQKAQGRGHKSGDGTREETPE